jgi:hypothetical protein
MTARSTNWRTAASGAGGCGPSGPSDLTEVYLVLISNEFPVLEVNTEVIGQMGHSGRLAGLEIVRAGLQLI